VSLLPGVLAHAAPISYRFPLPIWLYVVGGGAVVLLSAPAAALAVRSHSGSSRRSRDFYPAVRRWHLGAIGLTLTSVLAVWAIVGGLAAQGVEAHEFFENPATVLIWVDFWVLLGILSAFVGPIWDFVSPLNALARALDRALARRQVAPLAYPERLGQWPAVVLVVIWSWMELVWEPAKNPPVLAGIVLAYGVASLLGVALVGAEAWLSNVELFTVMSRTLARFAPLELTPLSPDDWLDEPPERRQLRLRPYGAGLLAGRPLPSGGSAFVLTLLATVVYDGFSSTNRFSDLEARFLSHWSWLGGHVAVLRTWLMLAIIVLFVLAYVLVATLIGGRDAARRYAPTLIPIAAVYFAAHYFTYILVGGQSTLAVLIDPFGRSWNPGGLGEYGLWLGIVPAALVWWIQVVLIVWGHVEGVIAAHRVELGRRMVPARALVLQAPLVLLMVAYTMAGLWVLAQQLSASA
jgi:hypothetical protein